MNGQRPARLVLWLPRALVGRATTEAARCGLTVRQFVQDVVHAGLAQRCCQHQAPADPPAAGPGAEDRAGPS